MNELKGELIMSGWDTGGAKDSTLKDKSNELINKIDSLNGSINDLNISTTKASNVMIVLTICILILTIVLVFKK